MKAIFFPILFCFTIIAIWAMDNQSYQIVKGASYYKVHYKDLEKCELHRCADNKLGKCKIHSPSVQDALEINDYVVTFYDRNDKEIKTQINLDDDLKILECLFNWAQKKLDPTAKPQAIYAKIFEHYIKGYNIQFYDEKDRSLRTFFLNRRNKKEALNKNFNKNDKVMFEKFMDISLLKEITEEETRSIEEKRKRACVIS